MMDEKNVTLSNCCDGEAYFCPPSLGEEGFFVCKKCLKQCGVHFEKVKTHVKLGKGMYRPIFSKD